MSRRFFVDPRQIEGERVRITGEEALHLARVLRLGPGDRVVVIDGTGAEYGCRIERAGPSEVLARIEERAAGEAESPLRTVLVQAIPKADRMELVIQKSTELGVSVLWPVVTERTVVRLSGDKAAHRVQRWQRVAREAAKQCGRARVPEVAPVREWAEAVRDAAARDRALLLVPWEEERALGLKEVLRDRAGAAPAEVVIFIGPEGGLTQAEVDQARAAGASVVSLGPRVLRTETAGLLVLSLVQCAWGDLGTGRPG